MSATVDTTCHRVAGPRSRRPRANPRATRSEGETAHDREVHSSGWVWVQRVAVVTLWIVAVLAWRDHQTSNGLSATGVAHEFIDSVETVLIMRFLFLPYDLVNYGAGALRIGRASCSSS